jgi:RimJ/RimL family protein N-acetyltransferase
MQINTDRLVIRPFRDTDSDDLFEYLSKEEVVRFEPYDIFSREEAAAEAKRRSMDNHFFAVQLKDGKLIGNLYLAEGDFGTWELGYVFNSAYWKMGYAYESAAALVSYAFSDLGARRITAMCNPLNISSWRLLERLGFRREGTLIRNIFFFRDQNGNPIWQDTFEYGVLNDEWHSNVSTVR